MRFSAFPHQKFSLPVCIAFWILPFLGRFDFALAGDGINWAPETFPGFLEPQHADDKCAGLGTRSVNDGVPITQNTCKKDLGRHLLTRDRRRGLITQQWFVQAVGPQAPFFRLRNAFSDKCMSVLNGSTKDGATIVQHSCTDEPGQLWDLKKAVDLPGAAFYQVVDSHSGLCLQVASDAETLEPSMEEKAPLIQSACDESISAQHWKISDTGINPAPVLPTPRDEVQLRHYFNTYSDLCAQLGDDGKAKVSACKPSGTSSPRPFFRVVPMGSYYYLVTVGSPKCLAVSGPDDAGGDIIGKECDKSDQNQQWEFLVAQGVAPWQADHLNDLGVEFRGTNGFLRLRNRASQNCLRAPNVSKPSSKLLHRSCAVTYVSMLWMTTIDVTPVPPPPTPSPTDAPPAAMYSLHSKLRKSPSSKRKFCAEIRGGRTNAGQKTLLKGCNSNVAHQSFGVVSVVGEYYTLVAGHTAASSEPMCISVRGGKNAIGVQGAEIIQAKCRKLNKAQQWKATRGVAGGFAILENRLTKMCIGVSGGAIVSGVDLVQFPCDNDDEKQLWSVERQ